MGLQLQAINLDTEILLTTLMAVGKTVGVALVGAWLRRSGRWSAASVQEMSSITSKIFLPCFVVASLAKFVTFKKLGNTVIVMLICLVEVAVSGLIGVISGVVFRIPVDLRGANLLSIVFGNSSAMPLILFEETAVLFSQGNASDVGVLYVLMYSMVNRFLMWTFGLLALEPVPDEGASLKPSGGSFQKAVLNENNLGSVLGLLIALVPTLHSLFLEEGPCQWVLETIELCGQAANPMMMFVLGANLAAKEESGDEEESSAEESEESSESCGAPAADNYEVLAGLENLKQQQQQQPHTAALSGHPPGARRRSSIHRMDALLPGREPARPEKLSHRVAVMSSLIRMVLVPACIYGVYVAVDTSPVPWKGSADPVLTFVVLLQAAVPGAIQLILIADYSKAGPRVTKALGELLLWQHIVCPVTMSLFIAFFLIFAGVNKDIQSDMASFPKNERDIETAFQLLGHPAASSLQPLHGL